MQSEIMESRSAFHKTAKWIQLVIDKRETLPRKKGHFSETTTDLGFISLEEASSQWEGVSPTQSRCTDRDSSVVERYPSIRVMHSDRWDDSAKTDDVVLTSVYTCMLTPALDGFCELCGLRATSSCSDLTRGATTIGTLVVEGMVDATNMSGLRQLLQNMCAIYDHIGREFVSVIFTIGVNYKPIVDFADARNAYLEPVKRLVTYALYPMESKLHLAHGELEEGAISRRFMPIPDAARGLVSLRLDADEVLVLDDSADPCGGRPIGAPLICAKIREVRAALASATPEIGGYTINLPVEVREMGCTLTEERNSYPPRLACMPLLNKVPAFAGLAVIREMYMWLGIWRHTYTYAGMVHERIRSCQTFLARGLSAGLSSGVGYTSVEGSRSFTDTLDRLTRMAVNGVCVNHVGYRDLSRNERKLKRYAHLAQMEMAMTFGKLHHDIQNLDSRPMPSPYNMVQYTSIERLAQLCPSAFYGQVFKERGSDGSGDNVVFMQAPSMRSFSRDEIDKRHTPWVDMAYADGGVYIYEPVYIGAEKFRIAIDVLLKVLRHPNQSWIAGSDLLIDSMSLLVHNSDKGDAINDSAS